MVYRLASVWSNLEYMYGLDEILTKDIGDIKDMGWARNKECLGREGCWVG